ncbi:hypothetical protein FQA39_LY16136 [Lamprigera yunnana]|nr:hypothetical protein FQA39_LY16136 [Lamprigera yunnana]
MWVIAIRSEDWYLAVIPGKKGDPCNNWRPERGSRRGTPSRKQGDSDPHPSKPDELENFRKLITAMFNAMLNLTTGLDAVSSSGAQQPQYILDAITAFLSERTALRPKFSGHIMEDPEEFLRDLEGYFNAHAILKWRRLETAATALTEDAAAWWKTNYAALSPSFTTGATHTQNSGRKNRNTREQRRSQQRRRNGRRRKHNRRRSRGDDLAAAAEEVEILGNDADAKVDVVGDKEINIDPEEDETVEEEIIGEEILDNVVSVIVRQDFETLYHAVPVVLGDLHTHKGKQCSREEVHAQIGTQKASKQNAPRREGESGARHHSTDTKADALRMSDVENGKARERTRSPPDKKSTRNFAKDSGRKFDNFHTHRVNHKQECRRLLGRGECYRTTIRDVGGPNPTEAADVLANKKLRKREFRTKAMRVKSRVRVKRVCRAATVRRSASSISDNRQVEAETICKRFELLSRYVKSYRFVKIGEKTVRVIANNYLGGTYLAPDARTGDLRPPEYSQEESKRGRSAVEVVTSSS